MTLYVNGIALYVNGNYATYSDSLRVEHIPK